MVKEIKISMIAGSVAVLLLGGCGYDNEDQNVVGLSKLISVTPVFDINASAMQPTVSQLAPGRPAFGIKGYKIVYRSHDSRGKDINVSGLLTVPVPTKLILEGLKQQGKSYTMSIVSDQHGTIFPDYEAPSSAAGLTHQPYAAGTVFSAVGGFVTIQPDYIGFGVSKDTPHPYLLEKASSNVVIDMIEAAIKFGNDAHLPINGQVYLTGYSEGGYVTLAAAKEIEANHKDIALKAVAPMSGPYDLNMTGMGVLSESNMSRPDFIGGIVNAYSINENIPLTDIVQEPYATVLPTLYDAQKTGPQIRAELTESIGEFFVPQFRLDFLTNTKNPLRAAFIQNSVNDYKPVTPTRLYYCGGDQVIPPVIAQSSAQKMGIESINVSASLGHVECAIPAYGQVAQWFVEVRSK